MKTVCQTVELATGIDLQPHVNHLFASRSVSLLYMKLHRGTRPYNNIWQLVNTTDQIQHRIVSSNVSDVLICMLALDAVDLFSSTGELVLTLTSVIVFSVYTSMCITSDKISIAQTQFIHKYFY